MQMKKLLMSCVALLMGTVMFAQGADNTFQFLKTDGTVVADGETIICNNVEKSDFDEILIPSGLNIRNTTGSVAYCAVDFTITEMQGGMFQICFPLNCIAKFETGAYETGAGAVAAGITKDLATEWLPDEGKYGTCTVIYQAKVMERNGNTYTLKARGPKITVRYEYNNPNGVYGVETSGEKSVTAYYNLSGRRMPVAQKGLNLVKYSDGTVRKIIVK